MSNIIFFIIFYKYKMVFGILDVLYYNSKYCNKQYYDNLRNYKQCKKDELNDIIKENIKVIENDIINNTETNSNIYILDSNVSKKDKNIKSQELDKLFLRKINDIVKSKYNKELIIGSCSNSIRKSDCNMVDMCYDIKYNTTYKSCTYELRD